MILRRLAACAGALLQRSVVYAREGSPGGPHDQFYQFSGELVKIRNFKRLDNMSRELYTLLCCVARPEPFEPKQNLAKVHEEIRNLLFGHIRYRNLQLNQIAKLEVTSSAYVRCSLTFLCMISCGKGRESFSAVTER